jgi:cell division protein FtsX
LILWFIIFIVLFWLIFYSLKPAFVLQSDSNQVDTAKVLLAAVIAALILVIAVWLIKVAISRRC